MLVNLNPVLTKASISHYAVAAYNINNLEWTKWILEACNEDKSPVILAVSETTASYLGGYKVIVSFVNMLINNISIPVVLHLDHAKSFSACKEAIDSGFTSVMIDASNKSIEENVRITIDVIEYAKGKNVSVEAEIGELDNYEETSLDDVINFYNQTGVDVLAPAVGNSHGIYKEAVKIDFELLGSISKSIRIPLVLHGASGLDENKIKTAVFCGVSKININTDLQVAWANAVKDFINNNDDIYDPRKIIASGEKAIKNIIHCKNIILESKNKAN